MSRIPALFGVLACAAAAAPSASEVSRSLREAGLDLEECYRVRDLSFHRADIRLYFTDGYLIFGKPVAGARFSAAFTAEIEGGEAEVILLPPRASERMSLAKFTSSPNLNEKFRNAVLIFSDDTAEVLAGEVRRLQAPKSTEMAALMTDAFTSTVRNLASSFEVRLIQDLLSPEGKASGFFYGGLTGSTLGAFDVIHDPRLREQIVAGQVSFREDRAYFNTWTSFPSRRSRNAPVARAEPDYEVPRVRIEASLNSDLNLSVTTRATAVVRRDIESPLAFEISRQMRISQVTVDSEPAEVFQRDSLRSNLIRGRDSDAFLVVPAKPLRAGAHEIEFRHAGDVVSRAGNGVYYVSARGTWYPQHGIQYSTYDLTFRYPRELNLVATGTIAEEQTEAEWKVTRRTVSAPVRLVAFNLGDYEHATAKRGSLLVDVFANRKAEAALNRQRDVVLLPPAAVPTFPPRRTPQQPMPVPMATLPPLDPTARLGQFAGEIANAFDFMAAHLGPPPLSELQVSPIPGTFGQGFPGMIFLSTISYLNPSDRPPALRQSSDALFFSEILHAHETAHQWWGNAVASAGYQDDWLMEALANYTALLYLEKNKGMRAMESVLDSYRNRLLAKDDDGNTVESTGPLMWGLRLQSSKAPSAWRTITYEKGSWVLHMLRRRLGDAKFLALLGQICKQYRNAALSTEQFRETAAAFVPKEWRDPKLEAFFERWVYSTGIPELKLTWSVKGKAPALRLTGTVTQTGVEDDFSTEVPIAIQLPGGRSHIQWVHTSSEPVTFSVPMRAAPLKVTLDPGAAVLRR